MVSDAAAYIRSLAAERGRNADWAEKAVRESVSLTSEEALKQNVIEYVATSRDDLITQLSGKTIEKNGKKIILNIQNGVGYHDYPMSAVKKFLHKIAHPNVAYILMTIGIYGLIYELATPGIGLGGGMGVICLLLAFFSLQVLPINTVGVALIVLGMILLLLEHMAPSHGLIMLSGLVSFALGSFMLIDVKNNPEYGRVSIELILSTVGTSALFFGVAIRKAFQARRAKPKTGRESLVGLMGVVKTELAPEGMVFLNGELWSARSENPIGIDEEVVVTKIEGNKLIVKKK
jgi:membrane-bound serine protease (ClpP class)